MATQKPRFSRRFLTILIIVTSLAIALLSRLEDRSSNGTDTTTPGPSSTATADPGS